MIYISDDILTINRHALFLHKTKTIKVSDIVEIEYHPIETSPYVNYTCQNDYNVVITYYKKYTRRKWFFICGLNFTEEEFVKFASTLKK
ncbi:MAG: hypothetical protein MJZ93_07130 [Paludibacteraceae bacterium]|nr:hypothetical protein [Paludibacteraceae bacterium]